MTRQQRNGLYGAKTEYKHNSYNDDVIAKLKENALFSVNILGQDINKVVYVVNGKRITAKELLS